MGVMAVINGIEGRYDAVTAYMRSYPDEYYLRRQRVAGRLPALYAEEVDRLRHQKRNGNDSCPDDRDTHNEELQGNSS